MTDAQYLLLVGFVFSAASSSKLFNTFMAFMFLFAATIKSMGWI